MAIEGQIEEFIPSSHVAVENFLRGFLYKARVLLIGGGAFNAADYDDEGFDVWVRINNHYQTQGGQVDLLYTAGTEEPPEDLDCVGIIECHPLPDDAPTVWDIQADRLGVRYLRYDTNCYLETNPFGPEHEWVNRLYKSMGTMPLTGMIAVAHLLSMPIAELTLAGIDFYDRAGVSPHRRDSHDLFPQMEWLGDQAIADSRLYLPEALGKKIERLHLERNKRNARLFAGA